MPTYYTNYPEKTEPLVHRIAGSTRIIDLTVEQLQEVLTKALQGAAKTLAPSAPDEYAYGLKGLAEVLGCGETKAAEVKASGKYKEAIRQSGRKIIINKTQLLRML